MSFLDLGENTSANIYNLNITYDSDWKEGVGTGTLCKQARRKTVRKSERFFGGHVGTMWGLDSCLLIPLVLPGILAAP